MAADTDILPDISTHQINEDILGDPEKYNLPFKPEVSTCRIKEDIAKMSKSKMSAIFPGTPKKYQSKPYN